MKNFILLFIGLSFYSNHSFSQNVWMFSNDDPDYQNAPFNDSLKLFQSDGTQLMAKSGFNIGELISAVRVIAASKNGSYCWVTENVSKKLSKIDRKGSLISEINKPIVAMDLRSNGFMYALGSKGTIGDSIHIVGTSDTIIKSVAYGGLDLVVDEANKAVWIVGANLKKVDLDLNHQFTIDPFKWTALSVDYAKDGSIWVAEGNHPAVGGKNRVLHMSSAGTIIDSVDLPLRPRCVRVNKIDGSVWVTTDSNLYSIDPAVLSLNKIASGGLSIAIDEKEDVWIAGAKDVRKYSKTGSLLLTINNFTGNSQKHIATSKDPYLSISNPVLTSEKIEIYPNPAKSEMTINTTFSNNTLHNIFITDVNGKVLYSSKFLDSMVKLNVNFLESGIYFMTIENLEGSYSSKFQVIK